MLMNAYSNKNIDNYFYCVKRTHKHPTICLKYTPVKDAMN